MEMMDTLTKPIRRTGPVVSGLRGPRYQLIPAASQSSVSSQNWDIDSVLWYHWCPSVSSETVCEINLNVGF